MATDGQDMYIGLFCTGYSHSPVRQRLVAGQPWPHSEGNEEGMEVV